MKIRFLRNVLVDMEKPRLGEVWDKQLQKWDELSVEKVSISHGMGTADIITEEGDVLRDVPVGSFEEVKRENKFENRL